jgi:aspartokinase
VAALGRRAKITRDLSLVALIGRETGEDADLAARAWQCLHDERVPVVEAFVGARPASQVYIVPEVHLERAANALHAVLLTPQTAL